MMDADEIAAHRDRFWARVDVRGPDDCWEWTAGHVNDGYGQFTLAAPRHAPRERIAAHRFALEDSLGRPLDDGKMACHHCDNPPCVNPAHLYEGTAQTNSDDRLRRGRVKLGARDVRRAGLFLGEDRPLNLVGPDDWQSWQERIDQETRAFLRAFGHRVAA